MPPFEAFRDAESDHATLAHGLTHWTEHPQRQCRDLGRKSWNDAGYAAEELIAKLASAFICVDLNLAPETQEGNAAYIASCRMYMKHVRSHADELTGPRSLSLRSTALQRDLDIRNRVHSSSQRVGYLPSVDRIGRTPTASIAFHRHKGDVAPVAHVID